MNAPRHGPGVLLTGAAGHLGRRIAIQLASAGAGLAICDVDDVGLARLAAEIAGRDAAGGKQEGTTSDRSATARADRGDTTVVTVAADVTDEAAARAAVRTAAERLGGLSVLVNAAGTEGPTAAVEDLAPSDVRRTFEVNVFSMFWLCGAAARIFKDAGGGRIVNLASGAGLAGGAFTGVYHASKHAVVGLTRSLARELGPAGIAVNAVCPGFVESPMVDRIVSALGDLDLPTSYEHMVPVGRYAYPDEVAETVRYLACEAPEYLTGACLVLDGGLRA